MDTDNFAREVERYPEIQYLRSNTGICSYAPTLTGGNQPWFVEYKNGFAFPSQLTKPHKKQFTGNTRSAFNYLGNVKLSDNGSPTTLNKLYVNTNNSFDILKKSFDSEFKKYSSLLSKFSMDYITSEFTHTALALSELKFKTGIVEFIENVGFRFTILFPGDKMVLITKSINSEHELQNDDIIYSFFINRDLIASDAMDLKGFVEGFSEYLYM